MSVSAKAYGVSHRPRRSLSAPSTAAGHHCRTQFASSAKTTSLHAHEAQVACPMCIMILHCAPAAGHAEIMLTKSSAGADLPRGPPMLAATGMPAVDSPTGSATEMRSALQSYLQCSAVIDSSHAVHAQTMSCEQAAALRAAASIARCLGLPHS